MGRGRELRHTAETRGVLDAIRNNRTSVESSGLCGCVHCGSLFQPQEISRWTGGHGDDAECPRCGWDWVIGDASGLPVTPEFLAQARDYWTDPDRVRRLER